MRSISIVSRPVMYGLCFTGIWPGLTHQSLVQIAWILMMGTGQVFQYQYIVDQFSTNELADLIDGFSTTLPYSLLTIKLIIFWLNQRLFNDILAEMHENWRTSSNDSLSINCMLRNAAISSRCAKIIMSIYVTAVCMYSTTAIDFIGKGNADNNTVESRNLLIKMAFPFSIEESFTYDCVMIVQFFQLLFVALAISILDSLMVTLILHISSRITIVAMSLKRISSHGDHKYSISPAFLRSLVCDHYAIIELSARVNKLFTYIALLQFFSNTLIICCIGFIIMTSLGKDNVLMMLIQSTFFYVAITLEAFVFCFSGEYLSTESKKISDAAYSSLWYTLTPQDSRALLLVMLRGQKTLTITAGRFTELSLESFASILKASASYVSVLTAMAQ